MDTEVPRWGVWQGTFEGDSQTLPTTNFVVEFTAPSGEQYLQPGFWDGGRRWCARFQPSEEGEWRYRTRSEPQTVSLHGQMGHFVCRQSQGDNRFLQHGPIRVSSNGHYLEHADGTPFLFLADTVWAGPLLAQEADWEVFLTDRVDKEFTGIQFMTHAPCAVALTNAEGETSFTGNEIVPVNPRFFRRMDQRIERINSHGLLAVPALLWAGPWGVAEKINPGCSMPEEDLIRVARYQIARFGAYHVLWILPGDGIYEGKVAETWKRIGRAVFGDRKHAPVTLHPCGRNWPYPAFDGEAWLDVLSYQSGHRLSDAALKWNHSGPQSEAWKVTQPRPIINLEPCYEDHIAQDTMEPVTAYHVRRACYWSMLNAPTAGLTYGGHGVWSWQERRDLPFLHPRTGEAAPWHEAKDLPGAFDVMRMAECFAAIPWWQLRPAPELVAEQPGTDSPADHIAAAATENSSVAIVYIPRGGSVSLDMTGFPASVTGKWFDPSTGESGPAGRAENSGTHQFAVETTADIVLVLKAEQ